MSYSVSQNQILGDLKTYLAIEVSQNNALTHGKYKLQLSNSTKRHADINSGNHAELWPLENLPSHDVTAPISPYNTTWSALHKQEWSDKKVERPKRKRQMKKCHDCRSRVGCQPHFTRIFQQENKANFLVPIDFCNSSRFCCKLFLFLRRPWHIYYKCTLM